MPAGRAAAGAAVIGDTLFVVAGIGPTGLTRTSYALDLRTNRWRGIPGPTPREHLAVTAAGGRVYALAGRVGGLDGNLRVLESWRPGERRWRAHPRIPSSRGGTAASTVDRMIVSIGGEAPGGTIASVYAYDTRTRRWRRLPDLPTPRHGLGAVTFGRSVYAIAGGPRPGLTTSGANEVLTLPEQRRLAAASGPAAASVVTVAFRTHGAITCGTELFPHEGTSRSLVCWRPRTGFAVSMTHLGRAFVRSSAAYRNWASEAPAAQLRPRETWWVSARRTVGRGTPPTGSLFRCTAGSNGLTCANAAGRGWWLGRAGGYRSR